MNPPPGEPNFLAIRFNDFSDPLQTGLSVQQYGVYDPDSGELIGITIKIGDRPTMMLPVVAIPPGAIRFDEDRPRDG